MYAGEGPARSEELGAWLVVTDDGERLRVADHEDGTGLWLTGEEEACVRAEEARAAEKVALAEVERLRAELAKLTR